MKISDKISEMMGGEGGTEPMKATDLLKQDHDRVRELFAQWRSLEGEDTGDAEKQELFQQIDRELTVHSRAEEEIFYPAVRKSPADEAEDRVLEAREEHGVVDFLLEQLRGMRPRDESFDAKMKVLMESVEHHADEEESEIFPAAEELGDRALDRMGKQIAERKAELVSEAGRGRGRSSRGRSTSRSSRSSSRGASSSRGKRSTSRSTRSTSRGTRSAGSSRSSARGTRSSTTRSSGAKRASGGARSRSGRKGASRSRSRRR